MLGTFIIPVGDLIDKLAEERERETTAIQNINIELDKIIKGEGITTYQPTASPRAIGTKINTSSDEDDDRLTMVQEETKVARNSINVKKSLKKPLLLDKFDEEEDEERKRDVIAMMSSPRVTTRKLSNALSGNICGGEIKRKMTV